MKESVFVVALPIDTTNDQLRIIMGKLKELRECGHYSNIILTVSGFGRDRRELSEIAEARAFCQRLIGQGFISYLDYTTTIHGPKVPAAAQKGREEKGGLNVRTVDWIAAYGLAEREIEAGREPRNPFQPGTDEHRGYEAAVSDLQPVSKE